MIIRETSWTETSGQREQERVKHIPQMKTKDDINTLKNRYDSLAHIGNNNVENWLEN